MNFIKLLKENDIDSYINIIANAYPGFGITDKTKVREYFLSVLQFAENIRFYGYFDNDLLLGGMRFHDYKMNFHNILINVGCLGLVAVDLLHKKEKICKKMVQFFLKENYEKGVTLVSLYPFRPDFYKNMGFGFGPQMYYFKVVPTAFRNFGKKSHLRYITYDDKEKLLNFYNKFASKKHGYMQKTNFEIESLFRSANLRLIGYFDNNEILGYIYFDFKKSYDNGNFVLNDMEIKEMLFDNREVFKEFSTFLNSQCDQINRIIFYTQNASFYHSLLDIRNDSNNLIPSVYHESNTSGVGIMYRIINNKRFFEELKEHKWGCGTCKVKFSINDNFLEENSKVIYVNFNNGYAEISKDSNNYDFEVKTDIANFTSIVLGIIRFKDAYDLSLVDISDEKYIEIVDDLFFSKARLECITSF